MLEEGSIVKIKDQEGIICIKDTYNGTEYVNISLPDNKFLIYKIETENNEEYLVEEKDKKILNELVAKWTTNILKEMNDKNG